MPRLQTVEDHRLDEAKLRKKHWKRWGPYLSERQWGTVREDYSANGTAWNIFLLSMPTRAPIVGEKMAWAAFVTAIRWHVLGLALWNGKDPILKERLFGLTGNQGNHGEDVKEQYFLPGFHADA